MTLPSREYSAGTDNVGTGGGIQNLESTNLESTNLE
jgi:hypothetical protein